MKYWPGFFLLPKITSSSRAVKILFLSFTCEDISVAVVTKINKRKSCVLCRNFTNIYKINRTLHGRLGIRIWSSRAESISHSFASLTREGHFQHSKIKFVSPRGHACNILYFSVILRPGVWSCAVKRSTDFSRLLHLIQFVKCWQFFSGVEF